MRDLGFRIPALRGRQGDRTMYLCLPTHDVLNTFFTTDMEPVEDRSQRALIPKHASAIGDYVTDNPDSYVLGAITYAVDVPGDFEAFGGEGDNGILHLPLTARLRSIDGQHRRRGLKDAIDVLPELARQHTALLLYVEDDLTARRQMFSDMNWTPRKVSNSLNVAFDNRDPFARATRHLTETHPLLVGRVEEQGSRVRRGSLCFFTLGAVYESLRRLAVGPTGRVRDFRQFPEEELLRRGGEFFDLLHKSRSEFEQARTAAEMEELRQQSILFSSTTLKALSGAVHLCMPEDPAALEAWSAVELVQQLSAVDLDPRADVWLRTGFVSPGKATPNARAQEVLAATRALAELLRGA